jgi:hypothetical protein
MEKPSPSLIVCDARKQLSPVVSGFKGSQRNKRTGNGAFETSGRRSSCHTKPGKRFGYPVLWRVFDLIWTLAIGWITGH